MVCAWRSRLGRGGLTQFRTKFCKMTCYSSAFIIVRSGNPWPDQKSLVVDMTRTTKHRRKRAYYGKSTAVSYVVYGTIRTLMIRTTGTY